MKKERFNHCIAAFSSSSPLAPHRDILYELGGDFNQRVCGPLLEPVDGGAVYQSGVHPGAVAETFSNRRHCEHNVKVVPNPVKWHIDEIGRGGYGTRYTTRKKKKYSTAAKMTDSNCQDSSVRERGPPSLGGVSRGVTRSVGWHAVCPPWQALGQHACDAAS